MKIGAGQLFLRDLRPGPGSSGLASVASRIRRFGTIWLWLTSRTLIDGALGQTFVASAGYLGPVTGRGLSLVLSPPAAELSV